MRKIFTTLIACAMLCFCFGIASFALPGEKDNSFSATKVSVVAAVFAQSAVQSASFEGTVVNAGTFACPARISSSNKKEQITHSTQRREIAFSGQTAPIPKRLTFQSSDTYERPPDVVAYNGASFANLTRARPA